MSSKSFERGKLLEQTAYDHIGTPVSSIVNTYSPGVADINSSVARSISNGKDVYCKISSPTHSYTNTFDYFHKSAYKLFYYPFHLTSTTTKTYSKANSGLVLEVKKEYQYNDKSDIVEEKQTNSAGEVIQKRFKYPADFSATPPYNSMVAKNMISPVVEQSVFKNNTNLISSTMTNYNYWFKTLWDINKTSGLILTQNVQTKTYKQTGYETRLSYDAYDDNANVTTFSKPNDLQHSYIWGYNKTYPIAEVVNARTADIAFTGFEGGGELCFTSTGPASSITYREARTGVSAYRFNAGNPVWGPTQDLVPAQKGKYVFSCWAKTDADFGNAYLILHTSDPYGDASATFPQNAESYKVTAINNTYGQWKYFEVMLDLDKVKQLSGISQTLRLRAYVYNTDAGHGFYVDDLRLFPANAQMTTYTYDPLNGITSQTDVNNRTVYYDYDGFGRLSLIRDHDKNVVKKYCYNYKGQQENCNTPVPVTYGNDPINEYYYSENCGSQSPVPYWVSVSRDMFTSTVSALDANQQAQQYAQSQANQYGTCQAPNVSLFYSNNNGTNFYINVYNVNTGEEFWFEAYSYSSGELGTVLPGTYHIAISSSDYYNYYSYSVGCGYYSSGSNSISFYNVPLNSGCNSFQMY